MKKKGFTLVELLVVIAIIAMLLAILMPALGKVRQLAYRMMCGTNLSGLGKALMVYSNDYDEQYAIGGKSGNVWADTSNTSGGTSSLGTNWCKINANANFKTTDKITVSQSLFLLIKYADVSPAQFNCQGADQKKFELDKSDTGAQNYVGNTNQDAKDVTECWDFGETATKFNGKGPWNYVSYSYQMPYGLNAPGVSGPAGLAIMADKNPFYDRTSNRKNYMDGDTANNIDPGFLKITDPKMLEQNQKMKWGNAAPHQGDGQNVLFSDSHVSFEKTPNVGIQQDNIYTPWKTNNNPTDLDIQIGKDPRTLTPGASSSNSAADSVNADDSFLVNDGPQIDS